ncbi:hypothetical protein DYD21_06125 [Rhodohalobacter sp. SW132]|uniref:capsule assembly Wzi family protein n=1 Tax=Rhodohalobacter sp. SW132 TaxID=2293433 RepID=UPI000E289DAA|nr:capsule assembly Wzi family protein [Rhodohalobacter sp. SW132]REL38183.1 hypothetical protein DYD21_06125 [Rhodohalobacter sp. SW132]
MKKLIAGLLFSILLVCLSGFLLKTIAQTLTTSFDVAGVVSSSDTTPFWIQSNRHGIYHRSGDQLLTRLQLHARSDLFDNPQISTQYGADLIARPGSDGTLSFNQAYLRVNVYGVELTGGRFHNSSPIHDEKLGMGSLGVSTNSAPVPQVRIGLADWTSLPFTNDFIQIRAHAAHGWLRGERYTDNVLYHEKVGHARFGGDFPLNLYGGIAHYAKWGGKNNPQFGDLPSGFVDFWRVFFARGGGDDAPAVEADYMLGDHLGAWDFGFFLEMDLFSATFYRQHPLETKDNLKLKSMQDALNGFSVRLHESINFPVRGFVYEFMYTKWQDGPRVENILDDGTRCSEEPERCRDPFQGNENYYNHHIYRTGWATHGRTIGNALFRTSQTPLDQLVDGIDNNRIIAHHIGVDTRLGNSAVIGKATFSRNFGTRDDPFEDPANQISLGLQSQTPISLFEQPVFLLTDVAWDRGDLFGNQFGFTFGLRWVR